MNPIDPALITALSPQLWLDASDTSTLFNATSGGSLPAVGSAVARIEDKSVNGWHFTQATSSKRPDRQEYQGKSILRADGTSDIMTIGVTDMLRNAPGMTIFSVNNKTRGNNSERLFHIRDITNSFRLIWTITGAGTFSIQSRREDGITTTGSISAGTPNVDEWVINSGRVNWSITRGEIYKTKELLNSRDDFGTSGNFSDTTSSAMALFGNLTDANFMEVDFGEVMIFDYVLTDAQMDVVNNYLGFKWGLLTLDII